MPETTPRADVDVTQEWRATHGQKSAATRLRIFAAIAWIIAIGGEIAGIVLLYRHTFDHGHVGLLIGLLVGIAIFAIAGSLMWKAANRHDPARESDTVKFFVQNQLGAIITVIAFLPLVVLIAPAQGGDSPMLPALLKALRVARVGPGRPRTTPDALLGDKAYSSRATRAACTAFSAVWREPSSSTMRAAAPCQARRISSASERAPRERAQKGVTAAAQTGVVRGYALMLAIGLAVLAGRFDRGAHRSFELWSTLTAIAGAVDLAERLPDDLPIVRQRLADQPVLIRDRLLLVGARLHPVDDDSHRSSS